MGKRRRIERVKNHTHKYVKHTQKIFTNLTGVVFKHKKRSLAYTILTPTLFTCAVCLFFYGVNVSASSYVAKYVGAAVNGTWVKVDSTGNVNIEIVPTASGTLGIGKDNVSVETNANTGYRLYLSGINSEPNGYTALYRNGNPSDVSKFTSVTADPTSPSSLTNGQWGWALPSSAGTGTSPSTDANAFPSTTIYEDISTTGSTTDSSVISNLKFAGIKQNYSFIKSTNTSNENNPDNLNIYYGALADNSMTIGSYYNVIVYTAFVEGADTISVSPNAIQDNGTMTISTNIQGNASPITPEQIEITLYDPSDDTKNIGTCDNTSIAAEHNGTVGSPLELSCTFHANTNTMRNIPYGVRLKIDPKGNGIYLSYTAADSWKYGKPLDQITYMQDVTATDCAVTPTWEEANNSYTLTDNRDNKQYYVRKLADNRCWMTQNLDLDIAIYSGDGGAGTVVGTRKIDTNEPVAFTKENTDIPTDNWVIPNNSQVYETQKAMGVRWHYYGCSAGNVSSHIWPSAGEAEKTSYCNANTYEIRSYSYVNESTGKPYCMTYAGNYTNKDSIATCSSAPGAADTAKAGNMYNFPAVSAGTAAYPSTSLNATASICAKGWKLPTGDNGDWKTLFDYYKSPINAGQDYSVMSESLMSALLSEPFNLLKAGRYADSGDDFDGGHGYYGLYRTANRDRTLFLFRARFNPGATNEYAGPGNGLAARCVLAQ